MTQSDIFLYIFFSFFATWLENTDPLMQCSPEAPDHLISFSKRLREICHWGRRDDWFTRYAVFLLGQIHILQKYFNHLIRESFHITNASFIHQCKLLPLIYTLRESYEANMSSRHCQPKLAGCVRGCAKQLPSASKMNYYYVLLVLGVFLTHC